MEQASNNITLLLEQLCSKEQADNIGILEKLKLLLMIIEEVRKKIAACVHWDYSDLFLIYTEPNNFFWTSDWWEQHFNHLRQIDSIELIWAII